MELGTAVISTWERHPHMLAAQALTTQALVGERLVVGIGVNHQPHVEASLRLPWHKPVRHMLDYLAILGDLQYFALDRMLPKRKWPQALLDACDGVWDGSGD